MADREPEPERIVHFVFGLREQREPFHLLHYLCLESCRRVVRPDHIVVHVDQLPFGPYWDLIRPHVELERVAALAEIDAIAPDADVAPYRYAHHADVIRLDVLLEHGGMYADMDTIFVAPVPHELWRAPFVIGEELGPPGSPAGEPGASLCNALMLARPGSPFAARWRAEILHAMDGSWSAHSCQLAARLAAAMPDAVRIEPERSFTAYRHTVEGLAQLLEHETDAPDTEGVFSIHLWAHLWWDADRTDHTRMSASWFTAENIATQPRALCHLTRPFLPVHELW